MSVEIPSMLKDCIKLYLNLGFTVLPAVYGEKRPTVKWTQFEKEPPKREQVLRWFENEQQNVAIICGEASDNLVVLDFDDPSVYPKFFNVEELEKETIVVKTGSAKPHVYLRAPKPVASFKIPQLKLEVRSNGNIVIAPPSKHPSGNFYTFANPETKKVLLVDDLETSIWSKAEKLGVKEPRDLFKEEAEATFGAPYTGPVPPCIAKLSRGVEEGYRNEAAVRLASYWLKFSQETDKNKVLGRLKSWNILNKPPLDENELKAVLESASKLDRSYGCRLNQAWCDVDRCVLMRNRILDSEAQEEVERILKSPNVLKDLEKYLDDVLTGETNNKKLEFTLLSSGKVKETSSKQIILLKSEPGAGKTHLMKLADAFKTKDVGRFTPHALDYTNLENYEVLRLKELGAMDQEFQGVATIKFLSSDDAGYIVEVPVKSESGRWTTEQYRVPPITIITSTTRVELDPQFERRAWILNPDESEEQTKRIAEWKAKHEQEKDSVALGLMKETSYAHGLRVLRAIVRNLESAKVILPFPNSITKLIGYSKLRLRGDYDKFFSLIRLYALLHQKSLPLLYDSKGEKCVIATPSKAFEILEIAEEPYQTMASGLEKRTRELIDTVKEVGVRLEGEVIDVEKRGKIAVKLGKSEDTIYRYLKNWHMAGFAAPEKTSEKGKPVHFRLLFDLDDIQAKTLVTLGISENPTVASLEFEKEAESWLNALSENVSWGEGWNRQKALDALRLKPQEPKSEREDKEDSSLKVEKAPMTVGVSEIPTKEPIIVALKSKLSVQEALILLRSSWQQGTQEQFQKLAMKAGNYTETEAESLFNQLVDEGKLLRDSEGLWMWA